MQYVDENLEITERRVSKQMLIHQLPPVLILHMKRFSIGRTVTKDNQHVSFSPVLNMVPFCTTECVQVRHVISVWSMLCTYMYKVSL